MSNTPNILPKPFTIAVGFLSGALFLSAIGLAVASLVAGGTPVWALFGFEVVIAVAAVFGLLTIRNAAWRSSAMVFVCIAGTVMVASVLGHIASRGRLDVASNPDGVSLRPMLAARLGASAVIGAAAVLIGLGRSPRAWSGFIKGSLLAAPFLVSLASVVLARSAVFDAFSRFSIGVKAGVGIAAVLVIGVSLCAGAHYIIRAFEVGFEERKI